MQQQRVKSVNGFVIVSELCCITRLEQQQECINNRQMQQRNTDRRRQEV